MGSFKHLSTIFYFKPQKANVCVHSSNLKTYASCRATYGNSQRQFLDVMVPPIWHHRLGKITVTFSASMHEYFEGLTTKLQKVVVTSHC
jgi:hypothetical protein